MRIQKRRMAWLGLLLSVALSASAQSRTGVLVESAPAGAVVKVNGETRGVTPLRLEDLAPGDYTIKVGKEGHRSTKERIQLTPGEFEIVSVSLSERHPLRVAVGVALLGTGLLFVGAILVNGALLGGSN